MIWSSLDRYRDHGLLLLRLGFGLVFIWYHGWAKITGGPERWTGLGSATESLGIGFAPLVFGFLAAFAETVGALCIVLGLFFRPAALLLGMVMLVATSNHFVTGQGTPAHSFKNLWVLLGLVLIGPGRFSLDRWLANRKKGKTLSN